MTTIDRTDQLLASASSVAEVLVMRAEAHPDRVAFRYLADGDTETARLTYGALRARASAIARRLRDMASPGERALFMYPPGLEFVEAFFGCLMARLVPVPVYPPRPDRSLDRLSAVVRDASASVLMATREVFDQSATGFARLPESASLRWLVTGDGAEDDGAAVGVASGGVTRDDIAFLQYTSGSTGDPKGVIVLHRNLLVNIGMIHALLRCPEEAMAVSWLPQFHDMGLIGLTLYPVCYGGTSVQMPPVAFLQQPGRWLRALSRYRGLLTTAPNFAYEVCCHKVKDAEVEALDLSGWTLALNGAEPIRHDTLVRFARKFARAGFAAESLVPCYGMAEATLIITGKPPGRPHTSMRVDRAALERHQVHPVPERHDDALVVVSSGRGIGDEVILIVDPETGQAMPPLTVGEVWVHGDHVAAGYWSRIDETRETFAAEHPTSPGRRFLRTGDLGFLHEGELFITGRHKDLVIIDGRNLYPQDIEYTVERASRAVRKGGVAAFSLDGEHGETLAVVAELERSSLEGDHGAVVDDIARDIASAHEVGVGTIVLIEPGTIPKTSSGKIQRRAARRQLLEGRLQVVHRWSAGETSRSRTAEEVVDEETARLYETLKAWFREQGEVRAPDIDIDRPMAAYGVDSLTAAEFVGFVEDLIGEPVPDNFLWERQTIREMARFIRSRTSARGA